MRFGTKIFMVLLMLFVLTGQVMAASGVSSCDMDTHTTMVDHGNMDMSHESMENNKMDCCDSSCAMDCGLSLVFALMATGSFEVLPPSSATISLPEAAAINISNTSLYHPPISA